MTCSHLLGKEAPRISHVSKQRLLEKQQVSRDTVVWSSVATGL